MTTEDTNAITVSHDQLSARLLTLQNKAFQARAICALASKAAADAEVEGEDGDHLESALEAAYAILDELADDLDVGELLKAAAEESRP